MNPTQTLKELRAHILRDIQSDVKAIVKFVMSQPELIRREYFDREMAKLNDEQTVSLGLDKGPLYVMSSIGTKLVITDLTICAIGQPVSYASFSEKLAVRFTADLADTPEGALTPDQLIEKDWYFVHTTDEANYYIDNSDKENRKAVKQVGTTFTSEMIYGRSLAELALCWSHDFATACNIFSEITDTETDDTQVTIEAFRKALLKFTSPGNKANGVSVEDRMDYLTKTGGVPKLQALRSKHGGIMIHFSGFQFVTTTREWPEGPRVVRRTVAFIAAPLVEVPVPSLLEDFTYVYTEDGRDFYVNLADPAAHTTAYLKDGLVNFLGTSDSRARIHRRDTEFEKLHAKTLAIHFEIKDPY